MIDDRFIVRDGKVYDTHAEMLCDPTTHLMALANCYARDQQALVSVRRVVRAEIMRESVRRRVDEILARAGLPS